MLTSQDAKRQRPFFFPFLTSQESLPGVQFRTLARSMNSSLLMSPRAKRSARIVLASLSGERCAAHGGGPRWPRRTRKNTGSQHEQHEQEEHDTS